MMRSTLSRPVGLSNSYLTLEPSGISMTAWKSRGTSLPGETSCQACSTVDGLARGMSPGHYRLRRVRKATSDSDPEKSSKSTMYRAPDEYFASSKRKRSTAYRAPPGRSVKKQLGFVELLQVGVVFLL